MTPAPLRPLQTWLVIAASFLVAASLWPGDEHRRLTCAAAAVALIVAVLYVRLRAHAARPPVDGAAVDIAARIRADRISRMGPRR